MKELSDKIAETYNRDELNVLCYELGLDPDELEEGTESEFIWQIIAWCQRRGKLADLIGICREQRPHISWPDPPPSTSTEDPQTIPSADRYATKRKPLSRQTNKWLLVLGGMIVLFVCACATVILANNLLASFSDNLLASFKPTSPEPTSIGAMSTPHVEDRSLPSSEPSDTLPGSDAAIATMSISDLRNAGLGLEEIQVLGHGDVVNSVTWSPDSKQLATASNDGRIRIWDVTTGQRLQSLTGEGQDDLGRIRSIAWSPAGNLLLSSTGGAIQIWDVETGEEVRVLEDLGRGDARVVNWSPDSASFAWGSVYTGEGSVHLWNLSTMQEQISLSGHGDWVSDFAWSPDGTMLASGGENNMLRIWNATTGDEIYILTYHAGTINGLAWSPDSTMLVSVSSDDTLRIIEAGTGEQIDVIEVDGYAETVDWSSDGELIAIGGNLSLNSSGDWERVWVLDAQTGQKLYGLVGHTKNVTDVAWSPDSTMLASASLDDTVRIWRLPDSE